jgi:hypothetical protein
MFIDISSYKTKWSPIPVPLKITGRQFQLFSKEMSDETSSVPCSGVVTRLFMKLREV